MAYAASIDQLLDVLRERVCAKVDALALEKRRVRHGLLSVGLKLHCLGGEDLFQLAYRGPGRRTLGARSQRVQDVREPGSAWCYRR